MYQVPALFSAAMLAISSPLASAATPITCTCTSATLDDLVTCFQEHMVRKDAYSCTAYTDAQPKTTPTNEITGWTDAITRLLNADGACSLPAGSTISGSYEVTSFTDSTSLVSYCVLSEKNAVVLPGSIRNVFERGWGYFIAPKTNSASILALHHSAPHTLNDDGTPAQAAAVFKATNSRSLLVAGRHRGALSITRAPPPCAIDSCVSTEYTKSDPVHDLNEPFHLAMVAIREWQNSRGCDLANCGYIQWHGKGEDTCADVNVFISSGIASGTCYSSTTLPANVITAELDVSFPSPQVHKTPGTNSCKLTATQNLFGRLVNGVPAANICVTGATPCGGAGFGQFVHIEQDLASRGSVNHATWADVITRAYT